VSLSHGRKAAVQAFDQTLSSVHDEQNLSEVQFRDIWLAGLRAAPQLCASGWYEPPPYGMAVISGKASSDSRVSFSSLRQPDFWPTDKSIGFERDALYCYCSPISRVDLYPGDFAITLYFGDDPRVLHHFKNTIEAVKSLLSSIKATLNSAQLFEHSELTFGKFGLRNDVVSVTDIALKDLGHSMPRAEHSTSTLLSADEKERIRKGRRFINGIDTWNLLGEKYFTIEPQLRSIEDPKLPQISFHFQCLFQKHRFMFSTDVFSLYRKYMPGLKLPDDATLR
jgi:hypothetical protein